MQTENEAFTTRSGDWTIRAQRPQAQAGLLLLIHGWTGDETVMWIFTRKLAGKHWLLAPRGPVKAPGVGYGWLPHREDDDHWPVMSDFAAVTAQFIQALPAWAQAAGIPNETLAMPFDVMGFSQGAAMAYALTAHYPERVNRVAALAGFLPSVQPESAQMQSFTGKKIYVAHGTQDDTVPVSMAQQAVQLLQSAGAQVNYCESDVGHKLSAPCLRGLESFFS